MNRSDLVRDLSILWQIPQPKVEEMLEALLDRIAEILAAGEPLTICNFGKFEPRDRKASTRKNPRTGEDVKVEPTRAVLFHPAPAFKRKVQPE